MTFKTVDTEFTVGNVATVNYRLWWIWPLTMRLLNLLTIDHAYCWQLTLNACDKVGISLLKVLSTKIACMDALKLVKVIFWHCCLKELLTIITDWNLTLMPLDNVQNWHCWMLRLLLRFVTNTAGSWHCWHVYRDWCLYCWCFLWKQLTVKVWTLFTIDTFGCWVWVLTLMPFENIDYLHRWL